MEREAGERLRDFMKNVAWLRSQYGLSKRQMAKRLGVGVGTINKMEQGRFPPRLCISVLYKIYSEFGVTLEGQFSDLSQKAIPQGNAPSGEGRG